MPLPAILPPLSSLCVYSFPQLALVESTVTFGGFARTYSSISQGLPHFDVSFKETRLVVMDVMFLRDGLDKLAGVAKIVTGEAREEMVLYLELQSNVGIIHPFPRVDIQGCAKLHQIPLSVLGGVRRAFVSFH